MKKEQSDCAALWLLPAKSNSTPQSDRI